ncbi:trypsin-like peptidase domain-containing protein [Streptomyces sp. JJ36]|nr:trypsin-like peptidase domain-containing protein [Streptomyces sp. JJ36]
MTDSGTPASAGAGAGAAPGEGPGAASGGAAGASPAAPASPGTDSPSPGANPAGTAPGAAEPTAPGAVPPPGAPGAEAPAAPADTTPAGNPGAPPPPGAAAQDHTAPLPPVPGATPAGGAPGATPAGGPYEAPYQKARNTGPAGGTDPYTGPAAAPGATPPPGSTPTGASPTGPAPAAHASDGYGGTGAAQPPHGGWGAQGGGQGGADHHGGPGDGGASGGHGGGPHNPWAAPPASPPPAPRRRRGGLLVAAVAAAALVAGGVGGGIGYVAAEGSEGSGSTTVSTDVGSEALNRSPDSVAGIAAKALPSVVTIETGGGGESGTGTGFVYDKEGHILTNNHVVASAADGGKLTATFSDGKSYEAEIVGRAQGYDIAVIKLADAGDRELKPLPLGNSEQMKVGDATIAIGAPYGLSGTVTTGIVSAKNRPVASSDGSGGDASYMNALQTDASINPGNSGGPLLNAQGAVIGVNSAIQSGGGGLGGQSGSVGLGFAIPVNQAKRVASQLIETGVPVYPVIGVRVQTDRQGNGAVIAEQVSGGGEPVTPGGPADKAGLEPGDVITSFDGTKIDSSPTLIATIWAHKPGETVELTYERNGEEQTTEITLGSRKGDD